MRTPQRRIDPGVIRTLLRQPYRYEFFQAVRLLELHYAREGAGTPEQVLATRVAFRNTLSLSFPPSELQSIEPATALNGALESEEAFAQALADGALDHVSITPTFFGMLGAQGALPLHYTEIVAERETLCRDRAARAFFDIFSNRATALFYQAWKKYRLPFQHEVDRNRHYLPLLLSLAGMADKSMRRSLSGTAGVVHDEALAGYATAARHRPVSAAYLQQVLSDYFQAEVRVEQFVGGWYQVPPSQYSRLGGTNNLLGATALAGARVWQRDLRVRIWMGPLGREQYRNFLPGAEGALALRKMVTVLCGATLEYEVGLILRARDVSGCELGAQGSGRLGWDTFLSTRPARQDRSDARYTLAPVH
ncbi:type VI secretion system baseplate subunit TssG [Cupriavidus taiwanensis]|uniref:type VI secretion system baseplate subunit TssG n=1 Tax=Cupriavidus taiwanensis TaxID=164546 RepID=UPI001573126E|nr:type VI secretion system baseplate subunit TssG [Cupriavidus taiwanensis]NSX17835.1 type VI secretion system baseplate subunit TssG [Cupriavidus taiwanensis]